MQRCRQCHGKGKIARLIYGDEPRWLVAFGLRVRVAGEVVEQPCPRCRGGRAHPTSEEPGVRIAGE
jgi:DnaJ-class molecular chaperone